MSINLPPVNDDYFLEIFLTTLSILRPNLKRLTETELLLLKEILLLPSRYKHHKLSPQARKLMREALSKKGWVTSRTNFNNKVTSLVSKGYLFKDEDGFLTVSSSIEAIFEKWVKTNKTTINLELKREI